MDAAGRCFAPAEVLVRNGRVVAAGEARGAARGAAAGALDAPAPAGPVQHVALGDRLLLPTLVNAHAHLDLTAIGPLPYRGDFAAWLAEVVRRRPAGRPAVADSVEAGVASSRAAGVGVVIDIAGSLEADRARWATALPGVSCLELIGAGEEESAAVARAEAFARGAGGGESAPLRRGLSPHAPYSAGYGLYEAAGALSEAHGLLASTHLAESEAELAFCRDGSGPLAGLLQRLARPASRVSPPGAHPLEALAPALSRGRWLLVHVNHLPPQEIDRLAALGVSVACCPVASAYFGHGPPPWPALAERGVNLCLGTDAILVQPPEAEAPLGILPVMRHLFRAGTFGAEALLAMATVNGLSAAGMDPALATLAPGALAPLVALACDPREAASRRGGGAPGEFCRRLLEQALAGEAEAEPVGL